MLERPAPEHTHRLVIDRSAVSPGLLVGTLFRKGDPQYLGVKAAKHERTIRRWARKAARKNERTRTEPDRYPRTEYLNA